MKTIKSRAVLCLAGMAFAIVLAACSFDNDPSKILAVEVGNPVDTSPGKPSQPKPLRLVQVDLLTTDLEEIDQIDFAVQTVNLVLLSSSGKEVVVASNNLKPGSQLTLVPKNKQAVYFSVPSDALENNRQLKIQLKFVGENPGSVKVDSQAFAIAPQTAPLHLPLLNRTGVPVSEEALVIPRLIDKSSLFASGELAPQAGSLPPESSPSTPQPPSTRSPVYTLKGS